MLYVFFWVIPQRLNFIFRRFGTFFPFHLRRQVDMNIPTFLQPNHSSYLPAYEDGTECSETSAYRIQTSGVTQKKKVISSQLRTAVTYQPHPAFKKKFLFIIVLLWCGRKLLSFAVDVCSQSFEQRKSKSIPHAWDITIKKWCLP